MNRANPSTTRNSIATLPFGFLEGTGFEQLDPRFKGCVPGPERVQRLWTGARWCEGPAWFAAHRTLVSAHGGDAPRSDPCEPFSAHGFLGVEVPVVDAIVQWMRGEAPPHDVP